MIIKLLIHTHRILGTILCILCFSWFISGIVMIYHSFPRVSSEERFARQQAIDTTSLPAVQEVLCRLPEHVPPGGMSLNNPEGWNIFHFGNGRTSYDLYADPHAIVPPVDYALCAKRAKNWCPDNRIIRVDTLRSLDQWIPLAGYKQEFPIYKFFYEGSERYQLYISSRSGQILQFTDSDERFWARFGAIPHWVYFTILRENQNLWTQFIHWACYLTMLMCVAGFILGIRSYHLNRKKGFLRSPYKRRWFKWHHITGFFFGIVVFTWILSGYMSMAPLPAWLFGKEKPLAATRQVSPSPPSYALDYREAIAEVSKSHGPVKQIEWIHYQGIPVYRLKTESETVTLDASVDTIVPFRITEEMVYAAIKQLTRDTVPYTVTKMNEYDNYYISRRRPLPLPAYMVSLENKAKDCYYYNLESFQPMHYDTNRRWKRWLYRGLHSFDFKFFVEHPIWWTIVMWALLLGGATVSFTGIILSVKYLLRFVKKRKWLR